GWLNSAAMTLLGVPPRDGIFSEDDWFPLFAKLEPLAPDPEAAVRDAARAAAARGVVGIVDLEFAANHDAWVSRSRQSEPLLRVRTGVYPELLDDVLDRGLACGDALDESGLIRMGPLKIISDGSLGTRTAHCCEPYVGAEDLDHPRGVQNVPPEELARLLDLAHQRDLAVALHALGDAAVGLALDAFGSVGARGSVEHAQVVRPDDLDRMARLGVTASVQPAHLLDDRDAMDLLWPDRADRIFAFRTMLDRGVRLAMGSDAPVAPLDPWLAMAAAVHRSGDERPPWHQEEAITSREAFLASTDGVDRIRSGDVADVLLLDSDPFAGATSDDAARTVAGMWVAATFVAGRPTHWNL
ncbi:MAG: amidohydrolase family protein, partial [Kocuria sp.]|nr:amidohydrolase family protein [Kocuria sp.]